MRQNFGVEFWLLTLLSGLFGCAPAQNETPLSPDLPKVELSLPANGVQFEGQGLWVQPGASSVFCEVFLLDGVLTDFLEVRRVEMKSTPWLHHMSIGYILPEGITNVGDDVDPATINVWPLDEEIPTEPFECGWSVFKHVSSTLYVTESTEDLLETPKDTAWLLRGGLYILVEYHFTNPTTEAIPARVSANLHFVDEPAEHLLSTFFFSYNNIDIPPKTKKSHAGRCLFKEDVVSWSFGRHAHEYATGFHVWFEEGPRHGEHIWSSYDAEDRFFEWPEGPLEMKSGTGFRFQCDYNNTQDTTLVLGSELGQEMCILLGLVWSVDSEKNLLDAIRCIGARADPEPMPDN